MELNLEVLWLFKHFKFHIKLACVVLNYLFILLWLFSFLTLLCGSLKFYLLTMQKTYAQFVRDYYIKELETTVSSYDQEYLKETTPDDSSKFKGGSDFSQKLNDLCSFFLVGKPLRLSSCWFKWWLYSFPFWHKSESVAHLRGPNESPWHLLFVVHCHCYDRFSV
jgi:hypothetical protein